MDGTSILLMIISVFIGVLGAHFFRERINSQKIKDADDKARMIVESAERKAESLVKEAQLEAKDRLFKMKSDFDTETIEARAELKKLENRLQQKEENIEKKHDQVELQVKEANRKDKELNKRDSKISALEKNYNDLIETQKKQLETISGLTAEGAKELLIQSMENEARHDAAKIVKRITAEAKENADKEAKRIMAIAMQRYAGDYVAERTVLLFSYQMMK